MLWQNLKNEMTKNKPKTLNQQRRKRFVYLSILIKEGAGQTGFFSAKNICSSDAPPLFLGFQNILSSQVPFELSFRLCFGQYLKYLL